jgi:hypothetical protein
MISWTERIGGWFLALSLGTVTGVVQAQTPTAAATTTPAAPAAAPAPAPASAIPPPGYKLVPVQEQPPTYTPPPGYKLVPVGESPAETRYDVQYPQQRGALPPGMELPYTDGQTIPPGYHVIEQNRRGLIIAGSIVTGVPWIFSVTAAVAADFDNKSGFLLIPALGPWLMLAAGGGDNSGVRSILTLDGLIQTGGAVMFVSGFMFPKKRLLRDDVTVGMVPMTVGRDGHGLGVVGTF